MVSVSWNKGDITDTMHIEALLCGMAARLATEKSSNEELETIRKILDKGDIASKNQAVEDFAKISWDFHRRVNILSKSPRLAAAMRATSVPFVQDLRTEVPDWWCTSHQQHQEILEAMLERDAEKAEKLMREHYESASAYVGQHLHHREMTAG